MEARISKLRQNVLTVKPEICAERARYFTQSMQASEGEYIGLRRAKGFRNVLENISIYVQEGELVVGNQASKPKAAPIYPEYSYSWIEAEFSGQPYFFDQRPGDKFYYTEETKQEILQILDYWHDKSIYEIFRKILPEKCNQAWDIGAIDDTWVSSAGLGNIVADYGLILEEGLDTLIHKAQERMASLDLTQPDEYRKYWNLEAMIIANQAVIAFSNRFADKCEQLSRQEKDKLRREELTTIAHNCRQVPAQPARTFWEGLQSIWIVLLAIHLESNGHAISLGRFDQYLARLYYQDITNGILTRPEALNLVEAFFIKCNELNKLRSWPDTAFFLGYQMFINLAVGGQTADGQDAVNDLSYICLDACADLKLFTPSISVKHFAGTDDRFLDASLIALQQHQGGMPAFYNDRAFMRTLKDMGIAEEDLHNWVPDGCIEASIPGKWDFAAKGPWLNIGKILELTLNNGKDPAAGITIIPGSGDLTTFKDMDELMSAFKQQLHGFMELQVITEHINDHLHREKDLNPFRSSLISDCIGRGLDLIEGGSIYSADGGPTAGNITSADSLAAIEYVLFKKKLLTADQLQHALFSNFEDNHSSPSGEEIRQLLLNKPPRYGNDDDEADHWASEILEYIGSSYRHDFKNSRYGKGPIPSCYAISQSPVTGNIAFGFSVGATPNGRKAGHPFNNGISPSNGSEVNGPTAVINSVSKMPSIWFQKGAILNMRLARETLKTETGRKRVIALIKVLFERYGQHIQFNVVDNETYRKAQANPEEYADLMVRVSGYSTLFTPLAREVQDDLIERVEFAL